MPKFSCQPVFFALLSLSFGSAGWSAESARSISQKHKETLSKLSEKGYFRFAPCREFTDTILKAAGLPALGRSSPTLGERGDINRAGEYLEPPVLEDNVVASRKPFLSYRISTAPDGYFWVLRLKRTGPSSLTTETSFRFMIDSRLNRPSCELKELVYQFADGTKKLDTEGCLTINEADENGEQEIDAPKSKAQMSPTVASKSKAGAKPLEVPNTPSHQPADELLQGLVPQARHWLTEDCATALHYFTDAKDAVEELARKKIR